ncbi:MAG: TldD/PmbA family protein [Ruminococcus sp.]|nr:TldD/PmbA family protein [Ruminococcus sp.]
MYRFPEGVYSDVRVEWHESASVGLKNNEMLYNNEVSSVGAMIRVYDGKMWYTCVVNDLQEVQTQLDELAALAEKNDDILNDPTVKNFEVNKAAILKYDKENDNRKVSRSARERLVRGYNQRCSDSSIEEIKTVNVSYSQEHMVKQFYSSKGACIEQDHQECNFHMGFEVIVDGVTTYARKSYTGDSFDMMKDKDDEIIAARNRYIDYAHNAVDVEPGDYVCVLAPVVTAMFTHESFGHKSEADFMLNDKTLRDEWEMGKKVGSDLVSICDSGDMPNHGYLAFDDEGTAARPTWLIKKGVLSGRLHDAKSAAVLGEELTGNSRAQDFHYMPMVRMTNTYMLGGDTSFSDMIKDIKDGIYVYDVNYGTGNSTFTMQPSLCYRIRDGKICEPVRANVVTGSVFKTLFDIDALGDDYTLFDTFMCGKNGQGIRVSAGGPTIRVKSLTVN